MPRTRARTVSNIARYSPGVEYPTVSGRLMTVGTFVDGDLGGLDEEVEVGPRGVFGAEFDVVTSAGGRVWVAFAIFSRAVLRSMPSLCSRCRSLVLRKI